MATPTTPARPPLPPFTRDSAMQKARLAEDAWNTRDPAKVALAYAIGSRWRNRSEFINGRNEIIAFLSRKWAKELDLQADQGNVGVYWEPDRRAFRLRVARRLGSLVSLLRQ